MSCWYRVIDHRAPWYVFRGQPNMTLERRFFLGTFPLGVIATAFAVTALSAGVLLLLAGTAVFLWLIVALTRQQFKWTVAIPRGGSVQDYAIKEDLVNMRLVYAGQPREIQEMIEPVLVRSYVLARVGDFVGVAERRRAVKSFIEEMNSITAADRSDLDDLSLILKTREQMKREGLL